MQTITVLPTSLSLVSIPRSRLSEVSHPLIKQILHPSPSFFNLTANELEISLFGEQLLEDFEHLARRDRQRQRSRSGSSSSRRHTLRSTLTLDPIEISYEKWNVLQIDSHSDSIDNSGGRVNEVTAPLAAAGIPILYQSSYMSDFIFVKETRLREVIALLTCAGFDTYATAAGDTSRPLELLSSPVSIPQSPVSFETARDSALSAATHSLDLGESTVLTRVRSSADTSSILASQEDGTTPLASRGNSRSPSSGPIAVDMLLPELACVGLSDDNVEQWASKIIKLVAYPELIPVISPTLAHANNLDQSQHMVYLQESTVTPRTPPLASPSSSSSFSSDEEDGYFSHSPHRSRTASTSSLTSASRSTNDLSSVSKIAALSSSYQPPSKHLVHQIMPLSPITPGAKPSGLTISTGAPLTQGKIKSDGTAASASRVPFLSFTRTPEGSSLTTDVAVLATLFPPNERHMVICSGELDSVDERLSKMNQGEILPEESDDSDESGYTLKCLQIDLRRYGLDKHGLVNRFSRALDREGINHMFCSTAKSGNLLVDKQHAARAKSLLRSC